MKQPVIDVSAPQTTEFSWLPILMYHRVVPEIEAPDPYHLCITTDRFAAQMRFLAQRGYQPVTLGQVAAYEDDHSNHNGAKKVAITFDDGYLDVFEHAFPVLQEYGFTATVFVVSGKINGSNSWDSGKVPQAPLLGRGQIHEMHQYGISFGSHTRTHPRLSRMDVDLAWEEVTGSKGELEDLLGAAVTTFAYPYGDAAAGNQELVRRAGYLVACNIDRPWFTRYNLGRIDAARSMSTGLLWRLKLSGVHHGLRSNGVLRGMKRLILPQV